MTELPPELPPEVPLGKPTEYPAGYDPGLLVPIHRAPARRAMGITADLPFQGRDVWNGYEFSWLGTRGVPRVAVLRMSVDAASPRMIESKSMKLYLNGYAGAVFESPDAVAERLSADLSAGCGAPVVVQLRDVESHAPGAGLPGFLLDDLPEVEARDYTRNPDLLGITNRGPRDETLHTHLFRSLCPVTGQPDWASILIRSHGPALDRAGLLRYLVSYRDHQAFHEATIEQIFVDLKARCASERLLVAGYFLRRGGLDINPYRSDPGLEPPLIRLPRQ